MLDEQSTKQFRKRKALETIISYCNKINTGWPKQEKIIPPMAAETITTTRSDISLQEFGEMQ